jgi:hypothetical protein
MNEKFEDTKGLIRSRKSKKDRQHNDQQKKDRQHNGQKKDRQHNGQKKDRQHNDQKKDRQHNGQKKDRQHNGQTNKTIIYKILHNVLFKRLLESTIMNLQH